MKYIITEQQNHILTRLRRSSKEFLKPYIDKSLEDNPMRPSDCEDSNVSYYIEDVVNYAVDLILSDIDEDMGSEEEYDEYYDFFVDKCTNLFEDEIYEVYINYCP